jgi:hypothetical protein
MKFFRIIELEYFAIFALSSDYQYHEIHNYTFFMAHGYVRHYPGRAISHPNQRTKSENAYGPC